MQVLSEVCCGPSIVHVALLNVGHVWVSAASATDARKTAATKKPTLGAIFFFMDSKNFVVRTRTNNDH